MVTVIYNFTLFDRNLLCNFLIKSREEEEEAAAVAAVKAYILECKNSLSQPKVCLKL